MLAALALATALAASPDDSSRIRLGLDASDISAKLFGARPYVDESLLPFAPTSSEIALVASAVTTGVGFSMLTGFALMSALTFAFPPQAAILGAGLGFLLIDFGPNMGDLLNGDWARMLRNGLLRIAGALVLAFLGPYGGLVWLGWVATDVVQSRFAPHRWVQRTYPEASRAQSRIEPLPAPGGPRWATGNLLAIDF